MESPSAVRDYTDYTARMSRVQTRVSDEDLFAEEMAGVKPLGREARVRLGQGALSEDQQRAPRAAEGKRMPSESAGG
jgi:hypothetical protein